MTVFQFIVDMSWHGLTLFFALYVALCGVGYGMKWAKEALG